MNDIIIRRITEMNDNIKRALSFYDINVSSTESLNHNDSFKITDNADNRYFLKLCGIKNDDDVFSSGRNYHTYEQLQIESEILLMLSDSVCKTAVPIKNKNGDFVTTLALDTDGEPIFATITSFIDGLVKGFKEAPTAEMAYISGVSAARLHLESQKSLLPIAVKRPHKKQDYVRKMQDHIKQGIEIGSLTAAQYEMVSQCCDILEDCMSQLDKDPENNVGLVHADILNSNIVYSQNQGTLIDFSRCVYSYYLFDLAEMCLHADFGGGNPDLQNAILRGYHSVKPLDKDHLYAMQVLFVMFILTLMALFINDKGSAWLDGVLKWFTNDVHPCLASGKGYMKPSVYENILKGQAT